MMDEQIGTYVNRGGPKEIKKNVDDDDDVDEEDGGDDGAAAVDSEGSIIREEKAVRCPISKTSSPLASLQLDPLGSCHRQCCQWSHLLFSSSLCPLFSIRLPSAFLMLIQSETT